MIAADGPSRRVQFSGRPMATLRRIRAASVRIAPSYALCVILGAYLSLKAIAPGV